LSYEQTVLKINLHFYLVTAVFVVSLVPPHFLLLFGKMSQARSALMKVMINRYMKKHGIKDAPDSSTPGFFAEEECHHPCADLHSRVSRVGAVGRLLLQGHGALVLSSWLSLCVVISSLFYVWVVRGGGLLGEEGC